jgi:glycine/D-amino acid oxidase-like deaminating enzyme
VKSRTRYGVSPWADALPASARPSYPRLAQSAEVPVVIVGGGLAGAAAAYAFAAAGIRVALVEADRLGAGGTSGCAGHVLAEPGGDFLDHEARLKRRAARAVWQSTRRASLELQAAEKRLGLRCGLQPLDAVSWARGAEGARRLRREQQARKAAGLDAAWLTSRALASLGIDGDGGLRTHGHAQLDPLRACLGFAGAAAARGARIFERSPVTRVEFDARAARVTSGKAVLTDETVILATGEPIAPFRALERHFESRDAYAVLTPALSASVRQAAAERDAILADRGDPPHRLTWLSGDRILWTGGDRARAPDRLGDKAVVQRTGQLMYELSLQVEAISGIQPAFGWRAPYSRAVDGLPYVGPHRNYPRHLFAWGLGTNVASAFLASRILLRHYTGQADKDDEVFGFARFAR